MFQSLQSRLLATTCSAPTSETRPNEIFHGDHGRNTIFTIAQKISSARSVVSGLDVGVQRLVRSRTLTMHCTRTKISIVFGPRPRVSPAYERKLEMSRFSTPYALLEVPERFLDVFN